MAAPVVPNEQNKGGNLPPQFRGQPPKGKKGKLDPKQLKAAAAQKAIQDRAKKY